MADKDNFNKVGTPAAINLSDLQNKKGKNSKAGRSMKQEKGKTCCGFFSIRTGFIIYGVLDIAMFIYYLAIIINKLVKNYVVEKYYYIMLISGFPNVIALALVLAIDKAVTRKIYTYFLAVKIGLITFITPLIFMIMNHDTQYDKECHDAVAKNLKVNHQEGLEVPEDV